MPVNIPPHTASAICGWAQSFRRASRRPYSSIMCGMSGRSYSWIPRRYAAPFHAPPSTPTSPDRCELSSLSRAPWGSHCPRSFSMGIKVMNIAGIGSTVVLVIACNAALSKPLSETQCAQLPGKKIPAASIGLPTRGGIVTTGQWIDDYCLVSGKITPVDAKASNIEFQVALPKDWNSKVVMFGGGGFDGVIPKVTGNHATPPPNATTPLARGYVVFAGDSGHQATTPPGKPSVSMEDAAFFSNPESYRNYIGDALKKTRDSALTVVKAAYGHGPAKAYFFGGSKGGQEALAVIGRWPADWDGVVA